MLFARLRTFSPVLLAIAAMGCFTYADAPSLTLLQPGHDMRITLTPDGRVGLASKVGPQVRVLIGRLRSADTTGLTLALKEVTLVDGTESQWAGESTTIPAAYIDHADVRSVSPGKTAVLLAMMTGAAVALTLAIGYGHSSGGGTIGGTPGK